MVYHYSVEAYFFPRLLTFRHLSLRCTKVLEVGLGLSSTAVPEHLQEILSAGLPFKRRFSTRIWGYALLSYQRERERKRERVCDCSRATSQRSMAFFSSSAYSITFRSQSRLTLTQHIIVGAVTLRFRPRRRFIRSLMCFVACDAMTGSATTTLWTTAPCLSSF